jgi:branched-chain amino acid aminotransferase
MRVYLNGRVVQDDDAKVPVTDRSLLYGDGCFEGIGVCRGRVPLTVPVSRRELHDLILETASRNGMTGEEMGYLRPLGPLGLKFSNKLGPATLVIIPQTDRRIACAGEKDILTAAFRSYERGSLDSRIKANNYLTYILAFLEAQDHGADIASYETLKDMRPPT